MIIHTAETASRKIHVHAFDNGTGAPFPTLYVNDGSGNIKNAVGWCFKPETWWTDEDHAAADAALAEAQVNPQPLPARRPVALAEQTALFTASAPVAPKAPKFEIELTAEGWQKLGEYVAAHLPGEWTAQAPEYRRGDDLDILVVRADGLTLNLSHYTGYIRSDRDKIIVETRFDMHNHKPYNMEYPVIRVNPSRGGAALVGEIARRFLPDAEALYAACLKNKTAHEANLATTRATMDRLTATGAVEFRIDSRRDLETTMYFYSADRLRGKWCAIGSRSYVLQDRVNVELSNLTVEQAERILRILVES